MWARIASRTVPDAPWPWTDDTAMARVLVAILRDHHKLSPNLVAKELALEYQREPGRGYGRGAAEVLSAVAQGVPWQTASGLAFGGSGSYGNGAAMRAAPVGAYFADDLEQLLEQTTNASQVTHFHPEGIEGALAVALAAAWKANPKDISLLDFVTENLPAGGIRRAVKRAAEIPAETPPSVVAEELGNGKRVTALDTVPFCLWVAAHRGGNFVEAMWTTVAVLGDRDTTCAIVGGVLAASPDVDLPESWLQAREVL